MKTIHPKFFRVFLSALSLALTSSSVLATIITPASPQDGSYSDQTTGNRVHAGSEINFTEGSVEDDYRIAALRSGDRSVLDLSLAYSSAKASLDLNVAANTCLGFGWTHSYNVFLFRQQAMMFRRDGGSRTTKFTRVPFSSPVRYQPPTGYFETLVANPDGSFTISYPNGITETFRTFSGCPYFYKSPIYQLTERRDRNGNTTTLAYDAQGRLATITDPYGRQITFTYNAFDKVETVTDPLGRVTRFDYATFGSGRRSTTITTANTASRGRSTRTATSAFTATAMARSSPPNRSRQTASARCWHRPSTAMRGPSIKLRSSTVS
jgi:YD repeat-containing protein